jgi:hypothetical protein
MSSPKSVVMASERLPDSTLKASRIVPTFVIVMTFAPTCVSMKRFPLGETPTFHPPLTGIGAPKKPPLQTCRVTPVTVPVPPVTVTAVVSTCSTPLTGPFAVVSVQPVARLASVSKNT